MDLLVWSLRLPTNVQKAVRDLQRALFREQGLVSAVALPVLVPLLCLRTPPGFAPGAFRAAPPPLPAPRLRVAGLAQAAGGLVCRLLPRTALSELARSCRSCGPRGAVPARPAPLPRAQGIFLCFLEDAAPTPAPPEAAGLADLVFPGLALSLLRLRSLEVEGESGCQPWWSALSWEELARVPLRKGGDSA